MKFDGKVAAVTGGGSGIGLALAEKLAALGARVAEFGAVHVVCANAGMAKVTGETAPSP